MATVTHGSLTGNSMVNGVLWDGWRWDFGASPHVLNYYFANDAGQGWLTMERNAYTAALAAWSSVANIQFTETATRASANFVESILSDAQMQTATGTTGVFGFHDTPQHAASAHSNFIDNTHSSSLAVNQAGGYYNYQAMGQSGGWTAAQLSPGGFFERMFIHELGHGLGLKHPHDIIGAAPTFPGVSNGGNSQLGNNNLNHMFHSIMSYNRNYTFDAQGRVHEASGNNFTVGGVDVLEYGYVAGPMAFDIAAVQALYGSVASHTGNDVYVLPDADVVGTSWSCIWDTGGTDEIRYNGSRDAFIDLRPATLDNSVTGGGVMSHAAFIHGGFTIANGVVIENAVGGSGNDTFTGNSANNTFTGNAGMDTVVFNGNRSQFNFTETNSYVVTGASQGTDTLNSIERFQFNDITVTDDFRGGTATSGSIAVGGSATGVMQFTGDRDWFATNLVAGHRYVINDRGSPSGAGTLSDPFIRGVHNAVGALPPNAFNDDGGLGFESQLAIQVGASGTYYINAGAFGSALGTYQLDIRDVGTNPFRFEPQHASIAAFTPLSGGWSSQNQYPRYVANLNGDDARDIIAFGQDGVQVALATGDGNFSAPSFRLAAFAPGAGGWSSDNSYHREVADVNLDTLADIVGFGQDGVQVALGTGGGNFAAPTFALAAFAPGAGGWSSQDLYVRHLADVNGDGRADIVGFGQDGVQVALATGGGNFAAPVFALAAFAPGAGGWSSQDLYPRRLADVNADGRADIVGFGQDGVQVALATGGGSFAAPTFQLDNFAVGAGGWSSDNTYHRELADVTGDLRADIIGFGSSNVFVSESHDYILV